MENREFILRLKGKNEFGQDISPATLDIVEVQEILDIANKLITGDLSKKERGLIGFKYEEGCSIFKLIAPALLAMSTSADLQQIVTTNSLKDISPSRAHCVQLLQEKSKKNDWQFEIGDNSQDTQADIIINSSTNYLQEEPEWFDVEKYCYGELTDIGGSSTSNLHVRIEEGKTITIPATKVETEKVNEQVKVYHPIGVLVAAKENGKTGELQKDSIRFLARVPYKPKLTRQDLEASIEIGSSIWEGITNSSTYVRSKRNSYN